MRVPQANFLLHRQILEFSHIETDKALSFGLQILHIFKNDNKKFMKKNTKKISTVSVVLYMI